MDKEYNSMAFTPKEVEKGLHLGLLSFLLDYNSKSEDHYNDIHITTDGYCTIIEWSHNPFSDEWGGKFVYRTFEELEEEYYRCEDELNECLDTLDNKKLTKKTVTKADLNDYMSELDKLYKPIGDKKEGE